jgi:hypothetical protein
MGGQSVSLLSFESQFLYDAANQVAVNGNLMLRGLNLDEVEKLDQNVETVMERCPQAPNAFSTNIRNPPVSFQLHFDSYFGITSRANLLATTSRISLRFFAAAIMASRDP